MWTARKRTSERNIGTAARWSRRKAGAAPPPPWLGRADRVEGPSAVRSSGHENRYCYGAVFGSPKTRHVLFDLAPRAAEGRGGPEDRARPENPSAWGPSREAVGRDGGNAMEVKARPSTTHQCQRMMSRAAMGQSYRGHEREDDGLRAPTVLNLSLLPHGLPEECPVEVGRGNPWVGYLDVIIQGQVRGPLNPAERKETSIRRRAGRVERRGRDRPFAPATEQAPRQHQRGSGGAGAAQPTAAARGRAGSRAVAAAKV